MQKAPKLFLLPLPQSEIITIITIIALLWAIFYSFFHKNLNIKKKNKLEVTPFYSASQKPGLVDSWKIIWIGQLRPVYNFSLAENVENV